MRKALTCPNGHRWTIAAAPAADLAGIACPTCGEVAQTLPGGPAADAPPEIGHTAPAPDLAPAHPRPAPEVPGYDLVREIGSGAMGVVYEARHRVLRRAVAVKLIRDAGLAGPAEVARVRAEAEAVARLNHPHIVQIYEVGAAGGLPYLAFEYLPGGTLAARLRAGPLPPAEAARLAEPVARAVQAAHDAGVVHRDLKPGNILLAADGTPKVADFGLAKQLDLDPGRVRTRTGAVLGTPAYMAPEQAEGRVADTGPAADVWALGAVLYELLTGRPPFRGATALDTLELVRSADPVPPRGLNPKVPRDIETVCLRCLQKEPRKRYPSAAALADDLARFLAGEPVTARPVGRVERAWRKVRRRPWVSGLAAACLLAAAVAGVLAWQWRRSEDARQAAEAEAARKPPPELVVAIPTAEAGATVWRYTTRDPGDGWAEPGFDDTGWPSGPAAFGSPGQPRFPVRTPWTSPDLWLRAVWQAEGLPDLTPVLRVYHDDDVRVWVNGRPVLDRRGAIAGYSEHPLGPEERAAFRPGANVVAVRAHNATGVQGVDVGLEWRRRDGPVAPTPVGPSAPAGPSDGRLVGHTRKVTGLAWFPDGRRAVSCGEDLTIRVWDVPGGRELARFEGRTPLLHNLGVSADGTRLLVGDERGLRVFDLTTSRELPELRGHTSQVNAVALSADGRRAYSGSDDGSLRLWDVPVGRQLELTRPHPNRHPHAVAVSADGRVGVSGGCDNLVKLFDPATLAERATLAGHTAPVYRAAVSADGARAVTVAYGVEVIVWDTGSGAAVRKLSVTKGASLFAVSADARRLLAATHLGDGALIDLDTGEKLSAPAFGPTVTAVTLSADGTRALVGREDGTVTVWDAPPDPDPTYRLFRASANAGENGLRAEYFHAPPAAAELSGPPLAVRTEAPESVWPSAAPPPGVPANPYAIRWTGYLRGHQPGKYRLIAVGDAVRVWVDGRAVIDGRAGRLEAEVEFAGRPLPLRVEFVRRDGPDVFQLVWRRPGAKEPEPIPRAALLHDDGGEVRSWRVAPGRSDGSCALCPSPDGRHVLTGNYLGDVRLWEISTGRELRRFQCDREAIDRLTFTPDGQRAAGNGTKKIVHVWDVASGQEIKSYPNQPGCNLAQVSFTPTGRELLYRSVNSGTSGLLEVDTGKFTPFNLGYVGMGPARWLPGGKEVLAGPDRIDVSVGKITQRLEHHNAGVWDCAVTADGRLAATAACARYRDGAFRPDPGTLVRIWDLQAGKELHRLAVGEGNMTVAFTPDGRYLLTGPGTPYDESGKAVPPQHKALRMYDVRTGAEFCTIGEPGSVRSLVVTPDGIQAVTAGFDGFVRVWKVPDPDNLPPRPAVRRLSGPGGTAYNVVWSPDGSRLLVTGGKSVSDQKDTWRAGVWDVATGRRLATGAGFNPGLHHAGFAPDGRGVVATRADGSLVVWSPETGEVGPFLGRINGWASLAVRGNAAVVSDGNLRVFDLTGGTAPRRLPFAAIGMPLALTPDGRRAIACEALNTLALVDLHDGRVVRRFVGHTKDVHGVAVSADGNRVATAGYDGTVRVWDPSADGPVHTLDAHPGNGGAAHSVSFSPDGKLLASSGNDGRVVLWDPAAGKKLLEWRFPTGAFCVAFSPDGRTLAVGLGDGSVYLLPAPEGW